VGAFAIDLQGLATIGHVATSTSDAGSVSTSFDADDFAILAGDDTQAKDSLLKAKAGGLYDQSALRLMSPPQPMSSAVTSACIASALDIVAPTTLAQPLHRRPQIASVVTSAAPTAAVFPRASTHM
jgi:hypothetical protein